MKTCVESLQKQIMGLFSIYKILSYWISHYRQRKSFRQTAKTGCAKSSFLAARNTYTRTTDYITFDFSFFILVSSPSRKLWMSLSVAWTIRIFQCLSSHTLKKFRQTTLDWERWRLRRSFVNLTGTKGEWRSAAYWRYKTQVKKYRIFSRVLLRLFLGLEFLV